jgi:hypothetical protein
VTVSKDEGVFRAYRMHKGKRRSIPSGPFFQTQPSPAPRNRPSGLTAGLRVRQSERYCFLDASVATAPVRCPRQPSARAGSIPTKRPL